MSRAPRCDNKILSYIFSKTILIDGCFIWKGADNGKSGYGKISYKGKPQGVHRVVYEIIKGDIFNGMDICHTCDNRKCVNPSHLFMGTRKDNMQDCISKKRNYSFDNQSGQSHPASKLSNDDVKYIFQSSKKYQNLAKEFNVTPHCIKSIKTRKNWSNITDGLIRGCK